MVDPIPGRNLRSNGLQKGAVASASSLRKPAANSPAPATLQEFRILVTCSQDRQEKTQTNVGGNNDDRTSISSQEGSTSHGPVESRLVAESVEPADPPPALPAVEPHGQGVQLRGGVPKARPRRPEERHLRRHDQVAALVA